MQGRWGCRQVPEPLAALPEVVAEELAPTVRRSFAMFHSARQPALRWYLS